MSVSLRRTTNTDQHKEPKCWFEELDQDTSRQDLRPLYDNATSSDFWSFLSLLICIAFVIGVGIWLFSPLIQFDYKLHLLRKLEFSLLNRTNTSSFLNESVY